MPYTLNGVNSYRNPLIDTNSEQKSKEEMEKRKLKQAIDEGRATERGTKIAKKGGELDKNSFLKILAAQMRNQDPTGQNNDPSAYVAQLAQFATLEQMQNLNQSALMLKANSMIGKGVSLKQGDENGKPITGVVRISEEKNGEITLGIEVEDKDGNSKIIPANMSDVVTVIENQDYNMDNININTALMQATSMIGKNVVIEIPNEESTDKTKIDEKGKEEAKVTGDTKVDEKDKEKTTKKEEKPKETVTGTVLSVIKENGGIFINVKLQNGEVKKYLYNWVVKIEG